MRLAIVSPYPPSMGTLNEYAFYLVKYFALKSELTELFILTDHLENDEAYADAILPEKASLIPCWRFNDLSTFNKINRKLEEINADAVLYNIQFLSFGDKKIPAALGLLSPFLSKRKNIPSVVLLHNIMESVDLNEAGITKNPLLKFIFNTSGTIFTKALLASDMITVTIAKYVEMLEAKYKADNVAWIPHGSFELPPMPDFEAGSDRLQVMTFGKFGTYKKVEGLIEAVEIVRKRTNKDIEIVIAGSDNPNVKGYLASVKRKYKHLKNIVFTGYVAEEDVPSLFTECTVTAFPYTSTTGSSGVLHQAGSYGKASILPNIGDLKELVEEEGYTGAFFRPNDINDLAKAIEKTLTDKDYRIEIAKQNYAAAASLPMEDITDWYMMHFKKLANKNQITKVA